MKLVLQKKDILAKTWLYSQFDFQFCKIDGVLWWRSFLLLLELAVNIVSNYCFALRLILNPQSTDWHPLVCNKQVKRNEKLASAMMAKKSLINVKKKQNIFLNSYIFLSFFVCVRCQNWLKKSLQHLIYGCHLGFQEELFADAAMLMCKVVRLIPQHKVYCTCNLVMFSIQILFRLFAFKFIKDE